MRVLVTRPQLDASRTAANLEALGHEALIDSLLTVERTAKEMPVGLFDALAATSANAMRIAATLSEVDVLRDLPLFAVGTHTARAARDGGFTDVRDANGDAAALAGLIVRELPHTSRVLHVAGEDRAQDLGALLAPAKIAVAVWTLYRMRAAESFGPAAPALASGKLDAVLHFSPRSAAIFVALAEREGLILAAQRLRHLCISQAAAAPLARLHVTPEIAAEPRESALVELLKA
jgi:uroporphyrinogen-III synthase